MSSARDRQAGGSQRPANEDPRSDGPPDPPPGANGTDGRPIDGDLVRTVSDLGDQIRSLSARVARLEASAVAENPAAVAVGVEPSDIRIVEPPAAGPGEPVSRAAEESEPDGKGAPRNWIDWERVLGRNWFAVIGAVALAVGVGFFLKLAFDNQWIGPTGRVVLGAVAGLALIAASEYTVRRAPPWSRAAAGGGLAILYLALYASFGFYELIPFAAALVLLGLTVAGAWVLAFRHDSRLVASIALFGAFLTPVLLGDDLGDRLGVGLAYLLVIDLGIVAVASVRRWRWYTLAGMVASYALFAGWMDRITADQALSAELGLAGIFLVFFAAATLHNVLWHRRPNQFDMTLVMLNALAFYGLTIGVMWERYEQWFGLITFLLALFHGLAALGAVARRGVSWIVPLQLTGAAVVFLTIAAPVQLTGEWVSVAWAAEGAVLVWLGLATSSRPNRAMGLAVLATAAAHILISETGSVDAAGFVPVLNGRFLAFAFGAGALCTAAALYRRWRDRPGGWEAYAPGALVGLASLLALWIISAEVISFFDRRALEAGGDDAGAWSAMLSTLTVAWVIYAVILMAAAQWRGTGFLAAGAVALILAATAKLALADTFMIGIPQGGHRIVLNYYFVSFLFVLAGIAAAVLLERRGRAALSAWPDLPVIEGLLLAANGIALWVFTAEVVRFFGHREAVRGASYDGAMHMTLTVMWALYGAAVVGWGVVKRSPPLRVAGIAVLAVPVAKLFVFDVFLLDRGYRVGAFVILGLLLLAMGLTYQRYRSSVKGFFLGDRPSSGGDG